MNIVEAKIEEFANYWERGVPILGKRIILEGANQDTTSSITCVATTLRVDLGRNIGVIELDRVNFRFWPGRPPSENFLLLGYRDVPFQHALGQIRSIIIEDGRIFVAEGKLYDGEYIERFLKSAIKFSATKFGQCGGAGLFRLLTD